MVTEINIISLPRRQDRREQVIKQMEAEKCQYRFFDGIELPSRIKGINLAHKSVIRWAKEQGLEYVIVAEDDLRWTGTGACKYFLDNIPLDYDLYVGSYYSGSHDENFVVKKFRGLTLYACHSRYYDKFLSLPDIMHIDGAIDISGAKIIVSPLFVATQEPGFSDQRKRYADDSNKMKGKELYKGNIGCENTERQRNERLIITYLDETGGLRKEFDI